MVYIMVKPALIFFLISKFLFFFFFTEFYNTIVIFFNNIAFLYVVWNSNETDGRIFYHRLLQRRVKRRALTVYPIVANTYITLYLLFVSALKVFDRSWKRQNIDINVFVSRSAPAICVQVICNIISSLKTDIEHNRLRPCGDIYYTYGRINPYEHHIT